MIEGVISVKQLPRIGVRREVPSHTRTPKAPVPLGYS
jgi:hypothetical protein